MWYMWIINLENRFVTRCLCGLYLVIEYNIEILFCYTVGCSISISYHVVLKQACWESPAEAALAQLEERWSHNPKVVSSILTSRILFYWSFFFYLQKKHRGMELIKQYLFILLLVLAEWEFPTLFIWFSLDMPIARFVCHQNGDNLHCNLEIKNSPGIRILSKYIINKQSQFTLLFKNFLFASNSLFYFFRRGFKFSILCHHIEFFFLSIILS